NLKTFADDPDPVSTIINNLTITPEKNASPLSTSNILTLSYTGPVPEDCPIILTSITDQYREFLDKLSKGNSSSLQTLVSKFKEAMEGKVEAIREKLRVLQQDNPLLIKAGKDGETLQRKLLNKILATKMDVKAELAELEIRKQTILARLKT